MNGLPAPEPVPSNPSPPASPAPVPLAPFTPAPDPSAMPPAATVVANAPSPREVQLAAELAAERDAHGQTLSERKARETRIAELEDDLHHLKSERRAHQTQKRPGLHEWLTGKGWDPED